MSSHWHWELDGWGYLPQELLAMIFNFLTHKELVHCEFVCCSWNKAAKLDFLWRRRFMLDFKIDTSALILEQASSWREEYKRLNDHVPRYEVGTISKHMDEVLHASFSNNGMMFCTCSKDSSMKAFSSTWPYDMLRTIDFGYSTQFQWRYTQYSQFNESDTKLLVSGPCCGSKINGEIAIFKHDASLMTFSLFVRIPLTPYDGMGAWVDDTHLVTANGGGIFQVWLDEKSQNFVFQDNLFSSSHNILSYLQVADMTKVFQKIHEHANCRNLGEVHKIHTPVMNPDDSQLKHSTSDTNRGATKKHQFDNMNFCLQKLVLCITGDVNDAYHQIGIKAFPCTGGGLRVRKFQSTRLKCRRMVMRDVVDNWDLVINIDGQVLGMALSPCNRYVYVNARQWCCRENHARHERVISADITAHVFDLVTMTEIKYYTGHKGFSTVEIFFINVACNEYYVASGSEDKLGHLWDKHYGLLLSTFKHAKIVNCVALNPCDPSMAVSVSDDHLVKVWESKSWLRQQALKNRL